MTSTAPQRWALLELLSRAGLPTDAVSQSLKSVQVTGLADDSRCVECGSLFVALAGAKHDAHTHVASALERGAVAAIVERPVPDADPGRCIQVESTRLAVSRLAASFYGVSDLIQRGEFRLVGVTGTNGKTTVATLIRQILKTAGHRPALLGTIANETPAGAAPAAMTTPPPIELARLLSEAHAAGADCAVMEVSSHALDQRRTAGFPFAAAVYTNLTQDHLDYHGTLEEYARAKRRFFDDLSPTGVAIINADDAYADQMVSATPARVLRYGLKSPKAEFAATCKRMDAAGSEFEVTTTGRTMTYTTPMVGEHNIYNCLAAAAAADALAIDRDVIRRALAECAVVRGRMERVSIDADFGVQVFVDYAHTPDALVNVLRVARALAEKRVICVFGCGGDRDRTKRPIMGAAVARVADVAVVTSDNPRSEDPRAIVAEVVTGMAGGDGAEAYHCHVMTEPDRKAAIHQAIHMAATGDLVLIAGKGHETYQIIGQQKLPFDDAEVAREALRLAVEAVL